MRGRGGEPWSYVHAKTGCQSWRSAARAFQLSALAAHSLALLRWRHQLPKKCDTTGKPRPVSLGPLLSLPLVALDRPSYTPTLLHEARHVLAVQPPLPLVQPTNIFSLSSAQP